MGGSASIVDQSNANLTKSKPIVVSSSYPVFNILRAAVIAKQRKMELNRQNSSYHTDLSKNDRLLVSFHRSVASYKESQIPRIQIPQDQTPDLSREASESRESYEFCHFPVESDNRGQFCRVSPQNYNVLDSEMEGSKHQYRKKKPVHNFRDYDDIGNAMDLDKMMIIQEARNKFQRVICEIQSCSIDLPMPIPSS